MSLENEIADLRRDVVALSTAIIALTAAIGNLGTVSAPAPAAGEPATAPRKRRTKAEIEADKAAEAPVTQAAEPAPLTITEPAVGAAKEIPKDLVTNLEEVAKEEPVTFEVFKAGLISEVNRLVTTGRTVEAAKAEVLAIVTKGGWAKISDVPEDKRAGVLSQVKGLK